MWKSERRRTVGFLGSGLGGRDCFKRDPVKKEESRMHFLFLKLQPNIESTKKTENKILGDSLIGCTGDKIPP